LSKKFSRTPAPLVIEIAPSRWLRCFYFILLLLACTAVLLTAAPRWALAGSIVFYLLVVLYELRQSQLLRLCLVADGSWHGCERGGTVQPLQLIDATVWPLLVVLRFRRSRVSRWRPFAARAVPLVADSVDAEVWRKLRIHLAHAPRQTGTPSPSQQPSP
jgi:hypothetical protein